jgi:lysophospholipase L1-like esterase
MRVCPFEKESTKMPHQPTLNLLPTHGRTVYATAARLFLLLALAASWLASAAVAQETDARGHADGKGWRLEQAKVVDAKRPRVLLMGDSILNGYLRQVIASLEGRAYVDAWVNPHCQASYKLDEMIGEVLAHGPYDVVHFNMGLHGWQKGRIPEGQFEPLTRKLVEAIRKGAPNAKLIWASSTPVTVKGKPGELDPEINPVIVEHNRMAAKVMQAMGVPVNDLYSLLAPKLDLARGDQFHWTAPAYKLLAEAVTAAVARELPKANQPAANVVEPSNAKELAAKKIQQEKAIDERFQQWKATLPDEQREWEETLEACLGSFYLPLYKRDKVEKRGTAWDYVKDNPRLPRVLLIGDSISRGYTLAVRKALAGKANIHRAPENCGPTANGLKKLDIWLQGGRWDVIHFNFGIHDRQTPPAVYEQRLEEIVKRLEATGAKLVWASSTPLPAASQYGSDTAMVERNAIAARVMQRHQIPIDDLYAEIHPRLADYQNANDCHFNAAGYEFLGSKVAREILTRLETK